MTQTVIVFGVVIGAVVYSIRKAFVDRSKCCTCGKCKCKDNLKTKKLIKIIH